MRDACHGPLAATDLGGYAAGTRAMNGRCQGYCCGAEVWRSSPPKQARSRCARPAAAVSGPAVLVVGAGPSGLSAAYELGIRGVGRRRGRPRAGAGRRPPALPPHRVRTAGPASADDRSRLRPAPGAVGRPTVAPYSGSRPRSTDLDDDGTVTLAGPGGVEVVRPDAVLLATGARERPRAARLVPGDRPAGVFTTGQLQQWVVLERLAVGRRAVVVGAEHVAYSAVLTLRHAGVRTVAMATYYPVTRRSDFRPGDPARSAGAAADLDPGGGTARPWTPRGVDVQILLTGRVERLAADTVVFTGDWIPDTCWSVAPGLDVDGPARRPPDRRLGTDVPVRRPGRRQPGPPRGDRRLVPPWGAVMPDGGWLRIWTGVTVTDRRRASDVLVRRPPGVGDAGHRRPGRSTPVAPAAYVRLHRPDPGDRPVRGGR